ncbi:mannose/fructose/sorbose PTS transporter subunit IIA [Selenomonas sputigena]|uniref:Mannose/fructose/sorbose PTS transporter subunit IIA n=1 Tax=Selenomonas sputigena TaxID=69823 RepID=A0ABV3X3W6_9FIRM
MFAIIVGTHGRLAEELLASAEMIFGEAENIASVPLVPGEGADDVAAKYEAALERLDASGGALFLLDLFGGTPYNAACRLVLKNEKYGIVTGVNLPMLVEMANAQAMDEGTDIRSLMEKAVEAGKKGMQLFHKSTVSD